MDRNDLLEATIHFIVSANADRDVAALEWLLKRVAYTLADHRTPAQIHAMLAEVIGARAA